MKKISDKPKKIAIYDHKKIEKKWQKIWDVKKLYKANDPKSSKPKKKFFGLIEFPYPSGDGLHVGHIRSNTAMDIIARKRRSEGYEVMYPIGWDAFGLPTENYAIKTGIQPAIVTKKNANTFRKQLKSLGFSFDWSREINTTDPSYYKWTQWIFLQFFKKGLAYKKKMTINWCPKDLIGLANEEVIDGCCERCGTAVEKKDKEQWMLAITKYAERLDKDLDDVDFLERIKIQQRNWIGKSEGMIFEAPVKHTQITIKTFSAHFEAFAADTFVIIAPDHPLLRELIKGTEKEDEVLKFAQQLLNKRIINKNGEMEDSEGIFTGRYIVDPVGNGDLPIWVASYALADYGTGIVKCSVHDQRDFDFAKKYNIRLKPVLFPKDYIMRERVERHEICFTDMKNGILSEPKEFNGKIAGECRGEIITYLESRNLAKRQTTFKLRDWIFSRQRYWGEPIPVVHCEKCGIVPLPEKDLPLKLPKVKNYQPTQNGESPLANISKWVNTKCPQCIAEKNKEKYFIFDFDGVLGDTWDITLESKIKMGDAKDKEDAISITNNYFSNKPNHVRGHKLTAEELQVQHNWIRSFGKHLADGDFELFTKFIKEIKKIKNARFAVVSSGSEQYVVKALKSAGLKFSHILAYEHHSSKEEKIESICKDWKVDVKDIYYFTDTKADVYELENSLDRKKILGCAWGFAGLQVLKEALPEKQILKDFKDIHRFFNSDCSAKRETDTMPNWAGSSWYYLRYTDPKNKKVFADRKKLDYWTPVDWYNGGMEHTTLHLLYSRFWHKFLFDLGLVPTHEPYKKRTAHGLILAHDGEKMSKSIGNVINPDGIIEMVGADSLRLYEMFMGPFDQPIAWNTDNIAGVRRFIERVWKLAEKVSDTQASPEMLKIIHKVIKKVSDDIEELRFNTAISALMISLNEIEKFPVIDKKSYEILIKLLSPFAPHFTEEIWSNLGNKKSIHLSSWPIYDRKLTIENEVTIIVQINGKMRGSFIIPINSRKEDLETNARDIPEAKKWLEGKTIVKIIVVPNKLVNIVVNI